MSAVNIQTDILTHSATTNRVTSFRIFPDGGLGIRMRNAASFTIDEFSPEDRVKLARFLMQGIETTDA
jgi:hypothetical protein